MLWIKAAIGAISVIIIQLLAQSRHYYLAALVPLFPTFALISHYILGNSRAPAEFKQAVLFSIFALLPYLGYLLTVYFSVDRLGLWKSLGLGLLLWTGLAMLLIFIWQKVF